jgi:hypothetical protein
VRPSVPLCVIPGCETPAVVVTYDILLCSEHCIALVTEFSSRDLDLTGGEGILRWFTNASRSDPGTLQNNLASPRG